MTIALHRQQSARVPLPALTDAVACPECELLIPVASGGRADLPCHFCRAEHLGQRALPIIDPAAMISLLAACYRPSAWRHITSREAA